MAKTAGERLIFGMAQHFPVSEAQFRAFVRRHAQQLSLVAEDNRLMRNSYLLLLTSR